MLEKRTSKTTSSISPFSFGPTTRAESYLPGPENPGEVKTLHPAHSRNPLAHIRGGSGTRGQRGTTPRQHPQAGVRYPMLKH
jgi:hypothetical protein